MSAWQRESGRFRYVAPDRGVWDHLRTTLSVGQRLTGTVVGFPPVAGSGIGVDLGLAVGGFVDALLLPFDQVLWPGAGTVAEFRIWWLDDRPQLPLVPVDPALRRRDADLWRRARRTPGAEALDRQHG